MSRRIHSPLSGIERQLDQRLVELQSLFELSQILNSSLQLNPILNNLLLTPMGRMMITRGLVMIRQQDDDFKVVIAKGLPSNVLHHRLRLPAQLDQPVRTTDLTDEFSEFISFLETHRITLILPINSNGHMSGIIGLGARVGDQKFSTDEIAYLDSLSNIAATAIQNALIFKELETVNRQLDKKVQELGTLFEIGRELNSTLDEEKIVAMLVYAVMGEMAVQRCMVLLKSQGRLQLMAQRGIPSADAVQIARLAQEYLSELEQPLVAQDAEAEEITRLQALGIALAIPMRIQSQARGVLLIGPKSRRSPFDSDEIDFLFNLANRAMLSLENARLFQEALDKQKIEDELALARDIQQRLLPRDNPQIPGVQIAGLNIPSSQVGGDYYDSIPLENARVACVIADVSGKGVGASLLMSNIQASIHSLITGYNDWAAMIARINNLIYSRTSYDKFITLFFIEIDPRRMQATFVNAGHNPPYLMRSDGTLLPLEEGGLIIGMMPDVVYRSGTIPLQKGDLILMFTDGVTEARNQNGEEFEETGVQNFLLSHRDCSVQEIVDRLLTCVREFAQDGILPDDLTVLGVRIA
ncbi:SpoIIE family protein phosphatase [candidate division KSB1 bacterium]|nr:SpoIIE family protein phosphatase [candidate division KSB1 bacterium]